MKINHRPIFDTSVVEEFYTKKDGVPVKYVCTSALGDEAFAGDIFYRDTPHPEFGNKYFQLFRKPMVTGETRLSLICIRSADKIEEFIFTMLNTPSGQHYSRHRHDFVDGEDGWIDGGRAYTRVVGKEAKTVTFRVKDGEFVHV